MITDNEKFIEIQGILSLSDISSNDCIKINNLIIELSKDNKELRKQLDYYKRKSKRLQQENQQLKDNWNKLKKYIKEDYGFYDKLIAPEYGCAMGALSRIKDKMQELEQGCDRNE